MTRSKNVQCKDILDEFAVALALRWHVYPGKEPGVVNALVDAGFPEKLALRKVERLVDRDFLEYGTSPYYAWPTSKGWALLREVHEKTNAAGGPEGDG